MQRKPLGSTGLMLLPFGLGWGPFAAADGESSHGAALPAPPGPPAASPGGVARTNWCDIPADVPPGIWERLRPLLLADELIVQARVGPAAWGENMVAVCQELRTRIGRQTIDLWQLAGFDLERIKGGQPFAMMRRLRDAGNIRFFSLRVTGLEDALWSLERTPVHALTVDAPLDEAAWSELLQAAEEAGAGIIATAACGGGDRQRAEALLQRTSIASFSWPVRL